MNIWSRMAGLATLTLALAVGPAVTAQAADETTVSRPDGTQLAWSDWVSEHAPAAVVLWASWAPGAADARLRFEDLATEAQRRNLALVVVSVQEDLDEARRGLQGTQVPWFHDRFGRLLKDYRVVSIPALLVLGSDGGVEARLEPTATSLRAWQNE